MKAFVHSKDGCTIKQMPQPEARAPEVLAKIKYAGLNRHDLYIPDRGGDEPDEPLVFGSDASGIVAVVGKDVSRFSVGDEVIINPSLRWERNSAAPPSGFDIFGMPDDGTFAEYIAIDAE